jgi:hypothetical protein
MDEAIGGKCEMAKSNVTKVKKENVIPRMSREIPENAMRILLGTLKKYINNLKYIFY